GRSVITRQLMKFLVVFFLVLNPSSCSSKDDLLTEVVDSLLKSIRAQRYGKSESKDISSDKFAIEIDAADVHKVETIARTAGFVIDGRLQSFENIYLASKRNRHKRDTGDIVQELISLKEVKWAEHLIPLSREKRTVMFSDPLYAEQLRSWSSTPNMFIPEAWEKGFSGKGVTLAVVDDEVDSNHVDLKLSYDPSISYSFIRKQPRGTDETHGTRCAGIIAMTANNSKCGVGVAHQSRLGGLTVLADNQFLNDAIEGDALAYKSDRIDIYSVSWGPKDDGRSAERPGTLAQKAIGFGAVHGRRGLGSLYVWASGNGGLEDDDCAMDGYASNLHTITFGVATPNGIPPWYSEGCSAVMAAISEDSTISKGVVTTDVGNKCVTFSGSSAAAPLAAGILALVLEANPTLSQRDIQHLIVRTSDNEHLMSSSPDYWIANGAGLHFSRFFGFGVLNALRLTTSARNWKNVPPVSICSRQFNVLHGNFTANSTLTIELPFESCAETSGQVNYLERLQLDVSIEHTRRGLISLFLTSPAGTTVQLLQLRKHDDSPDGLQKWPFISVAHWGENPRGTWRFEAHSMSHGDIKDVRGLLTSVTLTVYGTNDDPLKDNAFILGIK
uniref:P/Homo B domain-containing protein n=1 Tax=Haemonchus contortus TaxID=6289 RepID=A0A7I4XZS1_HAECO